MARNNREAANNISDETKGATGIEWKTIIGLRHIVVQEYFGINYDAIWDIAVDDTPVLAQEIEKLIKEFN